MLDPAGIALIAAKTSLMIGIMGATSVALMRSSAACRHFVWIAALALSLLMPFAILWLPSLAVIPTSWQVWASSFFDASHSGERMPGVLDAESNNGTPVLLIGWLAGSLVLLLRDSLTRMALLRWKRRATPLASPAWVASLARVQCEQGFTRPLRVLESEDVVSPCTWGLLRPVLLLPTAGAAWSETQRRHALLHELAHVRRFDYLSTFIARLACAMHWYNPLAWFAAAQARKLQEQACDDAVLRAGALASDYAESLLTVAARVSRLPYPARLAIGMFHRSPLNERIAAILHPRKRRSPLKLVTLMVATVPVSCLMLVVAAVAVAKAPPARSSVYSVASLFTAAEETRQQSALPLRVAQRAPVERLPFHERQQLQALREVQPLPALPSVPAVPARAAVPAQAAVPAVPAIPAQPAVAAIPATPAVPVLPQLPDQTGST